MGRSFQAASIQVDSLTDPLASRTFNTTFINRASSAIHFLYKQRGILAEEDKTVSIMG